MSSEFIIDFIAWSGLHATKQSCLTPAQQLHHNDLAPSLTEDCVYWVHHPELSPVLTSAWRLERLQIASLHSEVVNGALFCLHLTHPRLASVSVGQCEGLGELQISSPVLETLEAAGNRNLWVSMFEASPACRVRVCLLLC